MKRSQELTLKISEQREALVRAQADCEAAGEEVTAEQRAAVISARDSIVDLESDWRDAVNTEVREAEEAARNRQPEDGLTPEVRELVAIEERANVGLSIRQAVGAAPMEGADKELREAFELPNDYIPWNLLVAKPSEREEDLEERADATVAAPSSIQSYQNRIIQRVFSGSALAFLGVRPRMVGVGDQLHLTITAGAAGTARGRENTSVDLYEAATLTPKTTTPKRVAAGYRIATVDMLRVTGLESALRMDLGMALADRIDNVVLNNQSSNGLTGSFLGTGGITAPSRSAASAAADSFDNVIAEIANAIDGKHARNETQIRTVLNPAVGGWLAARFRGDSEANGLSLLRTQYGGVYISANMPGELDIASSTAHDHDVLQARSGPGATDNSAMDVWQGVMVIRDTVTRAKAGSVVLTFDSFIDFVLNRTAGFRRANVTI